MSVQLRVIPSVILFPSFSALWIEILYDGNLLYDLLYYLHLFLMFLVVISLIFHSLSSVDIIATYHIHLQQWVPQPPSHFCLHFIFLHAENPVQCYFCLVIIVQAD